MRTPWRPRRARTGSGRAIPTSRTLARRAMRRGRFDRLVRLPRRRRRMLCGGAMRCGRLDRRVSLPRQRRRMLYGGAVRRGRLDRAGDGGFGSHRCAAYNSRRCAPRQTRTQARGRSRAGTVPRGGAAFQTDGQVGRPIRPPPRLTPRALRSRLRAAGEWKGGRRRAAACPIRVRARRGARPGDVQWTRRLTTWEGPRSPVLVNARKRK
jgi:hypothetical protein